MARRTTTLLLGSLTLLAVLAAGASAADLGAAKRVGPVPSARASTGGVLIAPASACPGQSNPDAAAPAQERTMLCMVNYARSQVALTPLRAAAALTTSATEKSGDILACDNFSHFACGREFAYWIRANGYTESACWRVGENLAYGTGSLSSVRAIFRAWMNSPDHRENILGDFAETGLDLATGTLEGFAGTRVWTEHFGLHC